jgi:hypothetical protein
MQLEFHQLDRRWEHLRVHIRGGSGGCWRRWRRTGAPKHTRVSAVLFTKNLWPATLLMGQVYACLYLNPWPAHPYIGVLTEL